MAINIVVAGPRGKMGSSAVQMINNEESFNLVACVDRKNGGLSLKDLDNFPDIDATIYEDPEKCLQEVNADVLVDLTVPGTGYHHAELAIKYNVRPVVGTSGFSDDQINALSELSKENSIGCIIAPNFAIGAVLMMQFAKTAARYLPDVEIIEKHHDQKVDAPSGTAVKTAQMMQETRDQKKQGHPDEKETMEGARGAETEGIHIHSLRLPGLVAHQEVHFGGSGQTLTVKHDSYNRNSFMEGVKLSINKVMEINYLIYGLENVLE